MSDIEFLSDGLQPDMVRKDIIISNKAALLVRAAARYSSSVTLIKDGQAVNGKSIMSVMALAAEPDSEITIQTEGADEQEALDELVRLFENRFEED
jgi:phosphotransferase system HPr (HPr) family protein